MINKYSSNYPAKAQVSFNNFISIDSNEKAKLTAIEFALSATPYNVLGISSSVGNGATHLALAILNAIEDTEKGKEIFYSSYERLIYNHSDINELTIFNEDFLNSKSLILIDSFYESSDQKISKRLFNFLKTVNTKMIFTYNQKIKVPIVQKEINLTNPSMIEKEIIIRNILKKEKMNLGTEIINYISDRSNLSAREIEGLIIALCVRKEQGNSNADIELVKNILS